MVRPELSHSNRLRPFLESVYTRFHSQELLSSDPLEFVHHYSDPWDQEVVALICALLAYGNVKQIRASIRSLLERMQTLSASPSEFVRGLSRPDFSRRAAVALRGWVHRFTRGEEMLRLLTRVGIAWKTHGSVGAEFLEGLDPEAADVSDALDTLVKRWQKDIGPSYLLTAPSDGSCCKRWNMLLRWMGRKDAVDPGLWQRGAPLVTRTGKGLRASQLLLPLDTHTGRISQYLGMTRRRTLQWKAVREVSEVLRRCDPTDPIKYDFALARLGILDLCQSTYQWQICKQCQLLPVCEFATQEKARSCRP